MTDELLDLALEAIIQKPDLIVADLNSRICEALSIPKSVIWPLFNLEDAELLVPTLDGIPPSHPDKKEWEFAERWTWEIMRPGWLDDKIIAKYSARVYHPSKDRVFVGYGVNPSAALCCAALRAHSEVSSENNQ